jgi:hypothetical protein
MNNIYTIIKKIKCKNKTQKNEKEKEESYLNVEFS